MTVPTLRLICRQMCWGYQGLTVGFFCSGIQMYVLLSPYFCLSYFLYLDLCVLGVDASIS